MLPTQQVATTKDLFGQRSIQERFEKLLGKKAQGFISSVLQIVNTSKQLQEVDPGTVLNAAATAAALDLPINQNLGFAWIVPYKGKAQFQMGWKGFVQLALRTGQYKAINAVKVHENQFKSYNALTEELNADFSKDGEGEVVGYAAYFKLLNGMEKTCFWTKAAVIKHAKKYSQAYSQKFSPWQDPDQFDAMCLKTVIKSMISKWGIMSIEMQTAQLADQAVVEEEGKFMYVDNEQESLSQANEAEEETRVIGFIDKCETLDELSMLTSDLPSELFERLEQHIAKKEAELKNAA